MDSICSEWNADLADRNFTDSGRGAAFFGGALILMENKDISENYIYRGDNHPLGIMKNNGDLKTGAYTLKAWKFLTEDTFRVFVTDDDLEEFYVIASKSTVNSTVWILISNFSEADHNIKIMVNQLDTVNRIRWNKTDWEISDFRKFEILSGPEQITHSGGIINLEVSIIKESVRLIKLGGLGN